MAWSHPEYSKAQVDQAGRVLLGPVNGETISAYLNALDVINNWRSSHSFPLNTFQNGLRKRGRRVDDDYLVAQRIKRLHSIRLKLRRFPKLRLSQMQDIGGCRLILSHVDNVQEVVESYLKSDVKHVLAAHDDYINTPQISGYRGVHLVYKYNSDRNETYNSLKIEMQIRSQFQHAWATAVETVGTFIRQALKSSQGEEDWLRFFALMGTAIAFREGSPAVPGTPEKPSELLKELRHYAKKLGVQARLKAYGAAIQTLEDATGGNARYFLLALNPATESVSITGYLQSELGKAQNQYLEVEKAMTDEGGDAVLVSVESVLSLKKAFPNYFLDTSAFIGLVDDAIAD